ncbi:MAG: thioether cross-link-forming SCIFF peptide maturase [Oscillospiraceae bacterium]|jgi:uncharacterized protein|nr:thioether cross-link-forming SCIFF peptide maturase [Oscillospiraceae bacterium]
MIHTFSGWGHHVVLDVESGAVHLADELSWALLPHIRLPMPPACPSEAAQAACAAPAETDAAWREWYELYSQGLLFAPASELTPPTGLLKALCLHVSHDCDLRCGYCFAQTGDYGGARVTMDFDTARAAIDMLVRHSGARRNLEIDFFGGEPLLALDTVRRTVDYARAHESEWGKRFRFTLTTNGLALDDKSIDFLNREMDNVVLSLDGRPGVHDALRKTAAGEGSYEKVLPGIQALTARRTRDYYVRGTFTARNPDFAADALYLASLGFKHLSMEPVVLPEGHPLALRTEHLPAVFAAYDRLAAALRGREDVSFFHFQVDLTQGPCVYKRLRGCGAGFEYAAVTPEGDLYPCHQFVGREAYRMGSVREGRLDPAIAARFAALTVTSKPSCRDCWAKYFCSGGCAASALNTTGALDGCYALGCEMQKKRLECAILMAVDR